MNKKSLSLKVTAILAMLCAISIICGKYLAFGIGNVLRFSFENLPIIFAGMGFGPAAGLLVGVVSDLIGCLLVGYAINPVVTLGAAAIGVVSGICPIIFKKLKLPFILNVTFTVTLSHIIGSVLIKTFGLAVFYDMPVWLLMLWRLMNYLIVGVIEGFLLYILLKNKQISGELAALRQSGQKNPQAESDGKTK